MPARPVEVPQPPSPVVPEIDAVGKGLLKKYARPDGTFKSIQDQYGVGPTLLDAFRASFVKQLHFKVVKGLVPKPADGYGKAVNEYLPAPMDELRQRVGTAVASTLDAIAAVAYASSTAPKPPCVHCVNDAC